MGNGITGEWTAGGDGELLPVLPTLSATMGRCLRLACTRRAVPIIAEREGQKMPDGLDDEMAYWRGTIDARILLVDRVLQDMQGQIRQLAEHVTKMQDVLRQDMQAGAIEARAGNRWTYMIVGGGVLLAALLPFLLPLLGQGKRP